MRSEATNEVEGRGAMKWSPWMRYHCTITHRGIHDSNHWEDPHGLSYTKPTWFDFAG
jgi:hypothetical protein